MRRAPLQFEDIWQLPPDDKVASVSIRFEKAWDEELQKRGNPSLVSPFNASMPNNMQAHAMCIDIAR